MSNCIHEIDYDNTVERYFLAIPGVDREQIKVTQVGYRVRVDITPKDGEDSENSDKIEMPPEWRVQGSTVLEFTEQLNYESFKATHQDGVLVLSMAADERMKPKEVEVQVG